jgi:hypothetical protein
MENKIEYDSIKKRKRNVNEFVLNDLDFQEKLLFKPSEKNISDELRSLLNIDEIMEEPIYKKKKLN